MVIVKEKVLSKVGEYCQYNGKLFTGVALTVLNGVITKRTEYQEGRRIGDYVNPYFLIDKGALHIESSSMDDEFSEPCMYREVEFSGIAYTFDGDKCLSEKQYQYGWLLSEVTYDAQGDLKELEIISDEFSQKYNWFNRDHIERFEIFEKNNFGISLVFLDTNIITGLSIDGDYFNRIADLGDKVKYHLFDDKVFSFSLVGADYLYVSGSAVDEEVFNNLLADNGLSGTTKLRICRTPLTIESLEKLISFKNIVELYVESEIISIEDLKSFKSQRPDCFVEFNQEEVMS